MGVQLVLESPVEGQTDGQETGTQEDFTAPGEAGAAAALDLGRGWVGSVRWLLELFPKQVVLETWRWGSVTLDMSQRSFLDLFCLLVKDPTCSLTSLLVQTFRGADLPPSV